MPQNTRLPRAALTTSADMPNPKLHHRFRVPTSLNDVLESLTFLLSRETFEMVRLSWHWFIMSISGKNEAPGVSGPLKQSQMRHAMLQRMRAKNITTNMRTVEAWIIARYATRELEG